MFGGHRDGTQRAAKRKRTGVTHKHSSWGRVVPQKPEAPTKYAGGKDQDFACARHVMHIKVFSEVDSANRISNDAQGPRRNHHRHDRQTVQTVRKIHRICGTDDHNDCEGHKEITKVDQRVLEHRERELVLAIVGGLFVVEALSVIIQVLYYKRTGKRVFLMAPIHHHFEKLGWAEPQIVIRFWIISLILALIGLATLKVR